MINVLKPLKYYKLKLYPKLLQDNSFANLSITIDIDKFFI